MFSQNIVFLVSQNTVFLVSKITVLLGKYGFACLVNTVLLTLLLQITVFIILQNTVFSSCEIRLSLLHRIQFYRFANYSFSSVAKYGRVFRASQIKVSLVSQTTVAKPAIVVCSLACENCLLLKLQFFSFHKLQFFLFCKIQFRLSRKIQFIL